MRELADAVRIHRFMEALGHESREAGRIYFTGGASAVLIGWRPTTIDVDLLLEPEADTLLRALPKLKEALRLNVELASPRDFIPQLPGWRERSLFIGPAQKLSFFHYDFYSQALAKIERGHSLDIVDVREMFQRGLIEPVELMRLFERIEPELHHFPAIDPPTFRRAVVEVARSRGAP